MTQQPTTAELQQLRDQLRAEIREAHGTLKDLRTEIKTARELVPLLTDEAFSAEVTKQVEQLGTATKQAMDTAVDRVFKKFDELEALLMGEDKQSRRKGKPSVPALLKVRHVLNTIEADRE